MRLWAPLLLGALVLGCGKGKGGAPDAGAAHEQPLARLTGLRGDVQVRPAGKPYWESVLEGAAVRDGDWVRTRSGGSAVIEFNTGAKLELEDNALVIVELPKGGPAGAPVAPIVAVTEGVVRGVTPDNETAVPLMVRGADGQTVKVQPSAGQGRVVYRLSPSGAGTEVAVTKGAATVQSGEQTLQLTEGKAAVVSQSAPLAEIELPDFPVSVAPGIDARFQFSPEQSTLLAWKPVANAAGYRVQVARDLSFSINAQVHEVKDTKMTLSPEVKGLYVWRVATRAASGTVGEFGFARRIFFEAEDPKDLLLSPEDHETFGYSTKPPPIGFSWQAAGANASYRVMVSRAGDPKAEPVVNLVTAAQTVEVSTLTAGDYTWGVYIEGKVTRPIFLKPRHLVVKLVPKAKVKTPKAISKWE